jgi:histidinol-phosphate phosphatase family protein
VSRLFECVLFDRDGTLIQDVPYNGDPAMVRPMPGAVEALRWLRNAGLRIGVVSNQSGVGRGLITPDDVRRVNARVEELLGPFDTWQVCEHDPDKGCACRKPAPGLIHRAAAALGTSPTRCVVVGDIGSDVQAAMAAGAAAILVPTRVTRRQEIEQAPAVAHDVIEAADQILRRLELFSGRDIRRTGHVLVVRSDSAGDVLVTGPAIRAVAAHAERVTLLCGIRGLAAAELLPGVDDCRVWTLPWIDPAPQAVCPSDVDEFVAGAGGYDEAVIFTSYHQSALPLALLLRMAKVPRISAISEDYPGSLLDVRHRVPEGIPEPERAVSLAAAAGFPLAEEPVLRVRDVGEPAENGYVVVHPGTSVPQRACPADECARVVKALRDDGHRVLVTGSPDERALTRAVSGGLDDLGGRTSLADLGRLLKGAYAAVVANTGPAHLAAAVGTPVVSLFAPTVPFGQWAPYRVPVVRIRHAPNLDEVRAAVAAVGR